MNLTTTHTETAYGVSTQHAIKSFCFQEKQRQQKYAAPSLVVQFLSGF